MLKQLARFAPWVLLCFAGLANATGLQIPGGARIDLAGGGFDAAGGDVRIDGALRLGSGTLSMLQAFRIFPGGQADLGSGVVRLSGDWENRGTLVAGSSVVEFRDGAASESLILGNNDFASLSLVTATGKRYRLESGSLQTIATALTLQGQGAPIQLDVTVVGNIARLSLAAGGTQAIANVGVSDVHAVGQPLAPAQTNQGGRGNSAGWFGQGQGQGGMPFVEPLQIPGPSAPMLAALSLLMLLGARIASRRA